jgi:hypothetical protein
MYMKTSLLLPIAICLLALLCARAVDEPAQPVTYDFERLALGSLIRPAQDGWQLEPVERQPTPREILVIRDAGTGNRFLVGTSQDGAGMYRQNDEQFSFPALAPTCTVFASSFDVLVRLSPGGYGVCMALAGDGEGDADGIANRAREVGPWLGLVRDDFRKYGMSFSLRKATMGDTHIVPLGERAADGEWVRLMLVVDIADDTGSVFFKNLSRRQEVYGAVEELQNIPLRLADMDKGVTPYTWNAIYLRIHSHTTNPANRSNGIDNLVPFLPVPSVPEGNLEKWIEALRTGDARMREEAVKSLRALPPSRLRALKKWADDPDPEVSETIRGLLGR